MRPALWIIVLVVIVAPVGSAWAIGRRPPGRTPPSVPNKYYQNAANAKAIYPRYYGSIHASQIQNIGVPSGDIGLRGNGFMLNPW